jgi:hypothetical protein
MTPCLAPAKTDVAPQHKLQCIDLIGFRQTLPDFGEANLLRDNNTHPLTARFSGGFSKTSFAAPGGCGRDGSTLTNPGKS